MCLAAGTPVWTPTGEVAIQDLRAGDQVISRDPATGRDEARTVTATVSRPAPALVTLSLSDPSSGRAETLTCTPDHPLYVSGKGWAEAGDLGIGTSIVTRAGPPLLVQSVSWRRDETGKHPFTVYNLTVQGDHTYFAGNLDGGAWAHNVCFTEDQQGLIELAKQAERKGVPGVSGITRQEAQTLLDWAKELGIPSRGPEAHPDRAFGQFPHIHIGPINHIWIQP